MPFKSKKQRRYMHAKHPEIAKRWEREYGDDGLGKAMGDAEAKDRKGKRGRRVKRRRSSR